MRGVPLGDTSPALGRGTRTSLRTVVGHLQYEQGPSLGKHSFWGLGAQDGHRNLNAGLRQLAHRTCTLDYAKNLKITCSQCLQGTESPITAREVGRGLR